MKKFLYVTLAVILLLGLCACVKNDVTTAAPDPTDGPHTHSYGDWTVVTKASCTTDGLKERVCSCGEKETEKIAATGHAEETVPGKDATCTESGLTEGKKCSVCGETITAQTEIAAKGHTEQVIPGKDATCTEPGLTEGKKCSVCGETTVAQTEIPAKNHSETEIRDAVAASCGKDGYTGDTYCKLCGEKLAEGEVIVAEGHVFGEWKIITEATCTTDGEKERVCSCGEKETETIEAKGHTEEILPAKDATCTEPGLTEGKKCSACGEIFIAQTEIAAKGHGKTEVRNAVAATCTENGYTGDTYCTVCNKIVARGGTIPLKGHAIGSWTVEKEATCAEKGKETSSCSRCSATFERETDVIAHDYVDGVCRGCGATEGLIFGLNDDGESYAVVGIGDCTASDIVIPKYYEGKPVTALGVGAFYECADTTSVIIPDSVTVIGYAAFYNCTALTNITIPDSVTIIGEGAFFACTALTSIALPDGVTSIGAYAFYYCDSLTSIEIPDSVTSIGSWAFSGTAYYNDADNWEDGVLYIGNYLVATGEVSGAYTVKDGTKCIACGVFNYCYDLTSITIPSSVTAIGNNAFSGCYNLTAVYITDLAAWCNIDFAFYLIQYDDGVWDSSYDANPLRYAGNLYINGELATDITIPEGITNIGNAVFHGCTSLTSVTIPDGVTSIGDYAFAYCTGLTSINIPESVTSIGFCAFEDCYNLTALYITDLAAWCNIDFTIAPSNPLFYAHDLYINGERVTKIVIPESVTSIGNLTFAGCTSLTSIEIPNSVTSIGNAAFGLCSNLKSITIPKNVTSIGEMAFYGCSSLTSITVANGNTAYSAVGNCLIEKETKTLIAGCNSSVIPADGSITVIGDYAFYGCDGLTSVAIPQGVTSIGDGAFQFCTGLTSIQIPSSVTEIGDYAFYGCVGLTSVTISEGVTSIGDGAFYNCTGLTSIEIPESVTSIGSSAFSWCSSLTSITIPSGITSIDSYTFHGCYSLKSVVIPDSVTSIGYRAFSNCTGLTTITFDGTKAQWNVIDKSYNWDYGTGAYTVVCTDGEFVGELNFSLNGDGESYTVTGIGSYRGTDLVIPATYNDLPVTAIDSWAFSNCSNLTSVTIPDSIMSIGYDAFFGCTGLTSVTIPSSVTEIGSWAFENCSSLTTITFDGTKAQWNAIDKGYNWDYDAGEYTVVCTDGEIVGELKFTLNDDGKSYTVSGIGSYKGTDVVIPATYNDLPVTAIGNYAFNECWRLTSIEIPEGVTSIGYAAFEYCSGLIGIEIPSSVTYIGDRAFSSCGGLTSITVADGNSVYHSDENCLIETATKTLIAGCTNSVIPTDGSVTSIGTEAFCNRWNITSINIPDSITSIGDGAFQFCTGLTSIQIPSSVTKIGNQAFHYCCSLTSITVAEGNSVYHSDGNCLIETETNTLIVGCQNSAIPADGSVTAIGDSAFSGCEGLTSVVIPQCVTSIGEYAFSWCSSLTSVTIPSSVTEIGSWAFENCSSLTTITFDGTKAQWNAIDKGYNCDYGAGEYTVVCTDGNVAKPQSWSVVGSICGSGWDYDFPMTLQDDGSYMTEILQLTAGEAFKVRLNGSWDINYGANGVPGGENIEVATSGNYRIKLTLGETVTITLVEVQSGSHTCVDANGDGKCDTCGESVDTSSKGLAFELNDDGESYYVSGIGTCTDTVLVIPATYNNLPVTAIGKSAFEDCYNLRRIEIPSSVTSIGDWAFSDCYNLTSITIPDSVTSIGNWAFFYCCNHLTNIEIPSGVTSIGAQAFYGCEGLTSITLPDSLKSIGSNAFAETAYYDNADNWEEDVLYIGNHLIRAKTSISGAYSIKDGTKCIADYAFYDCESLTSITIPDSVTSIGDNAFSDCKGLTSITIPGSVTSIGDYAFRDCNYLRSIEILEGVTSIGNNAFSSCDSLTSIMIPGSVTSIGRSVFSHCGDLTSIAVAENNAVYHSAGNCVIETATKTLIASCKASMIPSDGSVTIISDFAFSGCIYLRSIKIPDGVTSIGGYAFSYCWNLMSIEIPDSVTSIGDCVFSGSSSLTTITVAVGNSVYHSTGNCLIETATKTLVAGCKTSEIPSDGSVTAIGNYAFYGCGDLTTITIPDSVTSIGVDAFFGCYRMTSITIPDSVTSIGERALDDCSSLTSITFEGTIEQWNAISKGNYWDDGTGSYTIYCTDGNISK